MKDFYKTGSFNFDFDASSFDVNYNSKDHCYPYDEDKCNPRWPHNVVITREGENDNPWDTSDNEVVVYKGACRSYRKSSGGYKDKVLTNTRMLSIKGFIAGLQVNDKVSIDKYGYKEEGYIRDVNTYMRGRGMTIEWDYERV